MDQNHESSLFQMDLDGTSEYHLNTISKWGKFISISGFIITGFFLVFIFTNGFVFLSVFFVYMSPIEEAKKWLILVIVVLSVLLFFGWLVSLIRLSFQFRNAVIRKSTADVLAGFKSLKFFLIMTVANTALSLLFTFYSLLSKAG